MKSNQQKTRNGAVVYCSVVSWKCHGGVGKAEDKRAWPSCGWLAGGRNEEG